VAGLAPVDRTEPVTAQQRVEDAHPTERLVAVANDRTARAAVRPNVLRADGVTPMDVP